MVTIFKNDSFVLNYIMASIRLLSAGLNRVKSLYCIHITMHLNNIILKWTRVDLMRSILQCQKVIHLVIFFLDTNNVKKEKIIRNTKLMFTLS